MTRGGAVRRAVVAVGAALLAAATAWAAQPAPGGMTGSGSDSELQRLVAMLDSAEYPSRLEATTALKIDERFTLARLEGVLRSPGLTPEQRERVMDVHRTRFERTPRAAMGVGFDFALPQRVVIQRTHEPFHVSKVLQPGDMIVMADGVRLHGPDAAATMRSIILSHDPGDEVPVEVRRGAELVKAAVRLGRWTDFQGANRGGPAEPDVRAAWRARIARVLAGAAPGPDGAIDTGLTPAEWMEMERASHARRGQHQAKMIRDGAPAVPRLLLAGGRPRNDMMDEFERERPELNGKDELHALQWQRMRQMGEFRPRTAAVSAESAEQEIEALRRRSSMLEKEIEQVASRGGGGPLQPGQEQVIAEHQRELRQIEQLIEAIRADAAGRE